MRVVVDSPIDPADFETFEEFVGGASAAVGRRVLADPGRAAQATPAVLWPNGTCEEAVANRDAWAEHAIEEAGS